MIGDDRIARISDGERRADLLALGGGLLGAAIFAGLFFATTNDVNGHYGLVQRLTLAAGGIWVAALAVGLLAIHGRRPDPAVRLMEWIRTLPGGQLVMRPGSGFGGRRPSAARGGSDIASPLLSRRFLVNPSPPAIEREIVR